MRYDPPLDVCLLAAGADPVLAAGVARFAERAECSPWEVEKLGRTAGRLVGEFSRVCIEDPLRAESMERAWERRRGSPDAGSLESELWRTARFVARVHYAVGLDPVVEPMSREDVGRVLEARPRFDLGKGVGAVGGTVQRSVPVWKLAQSVQEACLVNRKTVGLQPVAETSYCRERVQALGAAWPSKALAGLRERAAAEESRARTGTLLEAVIGGRGRAGVGGFASGRLSAAGDRSGARAPGAGTRNGFRVGARGRCRAGCSSGVGYTGGQSRDSGRFRSRGGSSGIGARNGFAGGGRCGRVAPVNGRGFGPGRGGRVRSGGGGPGAGFSAGGCSGARARFAEGGGSGAGAGCFGARGSGR